METSNNNDNNPLTNNEIISEEILQAMGVSRPAYEEIQTIIGRLPTVDELSTLLAMWHTQAGGQGLLSWLKGQPHSSERHDYLTNDLEPQSRDVKEPRVHECIDIARQLFGRNAGDSTQDTAAQERSAASDAAQESVAAPSDDRRNTAAQEPAAASDAAHDTAAQERSAASDAAQESAAAVHRGDAIYLVGDVSMFFSDSEYGRKYLHLSADPITLDSDSETESYLQLILDSLQGSDAITSYTPIGRGGLFGTLLRATAPWHRGFDILSCREIRLDAFLFGESGVRFIAILDEPREDFFLQKLTEARVNCCFLGRVTKGRVVVDNMDFGPVSRYDGNADV